MWVESPELQLPDPWDKSVVHVGLLAPPAVGGLVAARRELAKKMELLLLLPLVDDVLVAQDRKQQGHSPQSEPWLAVADDCNAIDCCLEEQMRSPLPAVVAAAAGQVRKHWGRKPSLFA